MGHFQLQNVALLTKIVALFEKKIWGAFWRLLAQKRALPDSKHLNTLPLTLTPHGPKLIFGRAPSERFVIKYYYTLASGNSNAHLLPTKSEPTSHGPKSIFGRAPSERLVIKYY